MSDSSDQQRALVQLLAELAAQRQNPAPIPPQSPQSDILNKMLVLLANAMAEMYPGR